ncbi:MAG: fibronectin type III domain-containing protein [Bacteroidetes bacterium]|nr:fibronectin type III domain-containing protein [Bacteroidota bacterium]
MHSILACTSVLKTVPTLFFLCVYLCCSAEARGAETHSLANDGSGVPVLSEKRSLRLSPRFTENRGQIIDTDGNSRPDVRFTARIGGADLYLRTTGMSHVFTKVMMDEPRVSEATGRRERDENEDLIFDAEIQRYRIDVEFVGANPFVNIRGADRLPGVSHFYYAHCPEGITHVPSCSRVVYEELYPGIDCIFSLKDGRFKYDFRLQPGADPSLIRLRYDGMDVLTLTGDGSLISMTPLGYVTDHAPISYQNGREVATSYSRHGSEITFDVGMYKETEALLIDPWATYFGGSGGEIAYGIALDGQGRVVLAGGTTSTDFPVHQALQYTIRGSADAVIISIQSIGVLNWATYYGGSNGDYAYDVSVTSAGTVAVSGTTGSIDFPTNVPVQANLAGVRDAFVLRLVSGGTIEQATYFGGSLGENECFIEIDEYKNCYVGTRTESLDFPVKNAFQPVHAGGGPGGGQDIALFKISSAGLLEWSTYYGGSDNDRLHCMDIDCNGNIVFSGPTHSADIPLVNPTHTLPAVERDLIIARISTSGSLLWATRYGGNGAEYATDMVCGEDGIVAVTARTTSTNLPVRNAIQSSAQGYGDALIAVFDSTGRFIMGSYLGGEYVDAGNGITIDDLGRLIVVGETSSTSFPVVAPQQATCAGGSDVFITRFDTSGTIDWSTYYGGSGDDHGQAVDTDISGALYIAGWTLSPNLQTQNAIDSTYNGVEDFMILCFASSGGGPPDAPSNLTGTVLTPTTVQLNWVDNANSEASFIIEHRIEHGNWYIDTAVGMDVTALQRTNLLPGIDHFYRVKAVNSLAESDWSNTLQIAMPPFAAPSDLMADSLAFASLILHWKDNSSHEEAFVVERSENGLSWNDEMTVSTDVTAVKVTGLEPLTQYHFRVRAVEGTISSSYSNTLTVSTAGLNAPTNLLAVAHSSAEVLLYWEDSNGGETGFCIEFRESGGNWGFADDTADGETMEFMVSGLKPATTYEFRIRALYENLTSGYSNTAQATTLLFLEAPTELVGVLMSETNITLSWKDNAVGESGCEIEHKEGDTNWLILDTVSVNTTLYDAQGLAPRTMHRFRVRAIGDRAASGYSNVLEIETRMQPAKPLDLEATALDHHTIRITWRRGSENEDGFEVERRETGESWIFLKSAGPGGGDILDENLPLSTTYWYRVRAVNEKGVSDWSNEDSATTLDIPLPDAPFGLRAEAAGPESITLHWIMPSPCTAERFEIEMSLTGIPQSFSHVQPDPDGEKRLQTVENLQPDMEYFFRIRAVNRSGPSAYSNTANQRTLRSNLPSTPRNVTVQALSDVKIELVWEMPDPSNEDGFELERSDTGDEEDFTEIAPSPGKGSRMYVDSGLVRNTVYYYRLRSYNAYGTSPWSAIVNARTMEIPISPALLAAMNRKGSIIADLENLLPEGDAQMHILRDLLGDHATGLDETTASILIRDWKTTGTDDPEAATAAMKRFVLFEEALRDGWGDGDVIPPLSGTRDIAMQAGRAAAIAGKNLTALALAWKDERAFLGADEPFLSVGMEDMVLSLGDDLSCLLTLMGSSDAVDIEGFLRGIILQQGDVPDLAASLMLSMPDYWQGRMLGRYSIAAIDPLIAVFAERTERFDITGTEAEATAKRDAMLATLRADIDALSASFSEYSNICYGLDAAYPIGQTSGNPLDVFMRKLRTVRPRIVDGMHDAIAKAVIPVERFLYLTSSQQIAGLGSIPSALRLAGNAVFDPVNNGPAAVAGLSHRSGTKTDWPLAVYRLPLTNTGEMYLPRSGTQSISANPASIFSDRDYLIELRGEVIDEDTDYITAHFDSLRRSGQGMIAEVASLERPLLGIAPVDIYQQTDLRDDYYAVVARVQLLKTRRTLLSIALADYVLGPTAQKQTDLVAEIDSIIGPLDGTIDDLTGLVTGTGNLITLPALLLSDADVVRDEASGPERCRIRFTVTNVGGGEGGTASATLDFLGSGVTTRSSRVFSFGALQPAAFVRDSMDVDIARDITHITLSAVLESGGRCFIDRRMLPVPQSTTDADRRPQLPASCLLHQNYPNPFHPVTTISFTLSRPMEVTLVVTDALGREVNKTVSRWPLAAGRHSVEFDASGLPSGVYFYRIEIPDVTLMRKMVFLQ